MTNEQIKKYIEDCKHRENGQDICDDMIDIQKQFKQRKMDLMRWVYDQ